jgi:hypothetical protein
MPTGREELDLKVYVDYRQERQNRRGPFIFCTDGTQLDAGTKNNCLIDPVTLSVFGLPLPMTPEWKTTFNGNYSRFQKSDFTFGNPIKWKNFDVYGNGDTYIISNSEIVNDQKSTVTLTNDVSRNEPLFFSFSKLQKKNSDTGSLLTLSWSNLTNADKNTKLEFKSDGSCDVYRGFVSLSGTIIAQTTGTAITGVGTKFLTEVLPGNKIYDFYGRDLGTVASVSSDILLNLSANADYDFTGEYSIGTPKKVQSYSRTESNYSQGRPISTVANPNDQYNDVYIIPMRGRDLLVLTSFGLNFCHTFTDLNVPDPPANIVAYMDDAPTIFSTNISSAPIILPSGSFKININQGKIAFQLAKLYFLSDWSIESQIISTPQTPPYLPYQNPGLISVAQNDNSVQGVDTDFETYLNIGDRISFVTNNIGSQLLGYVDFVNNDNQFFLTSSSAYKLNNASYYADRQLTGYLSYSTSGTGLSGSSTLFSTELSIGDSLYDNNDIFIGKISSITDNTNAYFVSNPSISGVNQTPVWKNINTYHSSIENIQYEPFGTVFPTSNEVLQLGVQITDLAGNLLPFNDNNNKFKIKISQAAVGASANSSTDYSYAFYSSDMVYTLQNEYTSDNTVEIQDCLETFDIRRAETGEMSISFSARKKILEDAGMVKPDIISNRPIKVNLAPRNNIQLPGTLTVGISSTIVGSGVNFNTLIAGSNLYKSDGTLIGLISSIGSTTVLSLHQNVSGVGTTEYNVNWKNTPNYSEITIFEGYLDSPDVDYIQGINYDNYALLSFNAIDKKQHLNTSYFSLAPNFDNLRLDTVIKNSLEISGVMHNDANLTNLYVDPTIVTYQVPLNRNNSNGQYNFLLNLGDTTGAFIEKLRSDFAQNFTFYSKGTWLPNNLSQDAFVNQTIFRFQDLDFLLPKQPPVKLFLDESSAYIYDGIPTYEAYKRTIRSLKKTWETPEANRIIITGLDKSDGSRIDFIKDDAVSQDPTLAPVNRPDNWLGDIYPFVLINDKLNSISDVTQTGNQFFAKLSPGREIIEFESDLLTYFDSEDQFTSPVATSLSGQISIDNTSPNVSGVSTAFLTELNVGQDLYKNDGTLIGKIKKIVDDSNLILFSNAPALEYNIDYNNYTYVLNQYQYIDIGDTITYTELDGTISEYEIIEWSLADVREYTDPELNNVIVRRANYRAKKVTIPNDLTPIFYFNFNVIPIPASNQWIITSDYDLSIEVGILAAPYDTLAVTLSNQPTGMTINNQTITWTPSAGQANQVYENIVITASNGTSSSTYEFSVRVYDVL